ncbi:hypothetical protein RN001_001853 [Aquatica leii]|uniref:Uncharacterized protein n=1 Tax=Aquatica leii TaxID=1421715 RepID=A0AAN7PGF7_9COLE|nr:hypothetical protein RN001_001853 [Aquatica leii]
MSDKQYKVIEFLDKHLVSVIPSNWVLEDGSCVWPTNLKNTRTSIIKRQKPADNWGQYQRGSFVDHGSFGSYENALQHEKKIVKSSESEDNIPSRYGRKIKTKKVTDYEEYLQPPSPTLSTASFSSDCRDIPNTRKCASEVQTAKIPVCSQQSVDRLSAINDLPTPPLVEKKCLVVPIS